MNKFNAVKTEIDGIIFDSKKEAMRYQELKLMERGHVIDDLQLQVKYPLISKSSYGKEISYIADFQYREKGKVILEDVKGLRKGSAYQLFKLKARMVAEKYEIVIREI